MADDMGVSRQSIIDIINRLTTAGLVERNQQDYLRTTPLWKETIAFYELRLAENKPSSLTDRSEGSLKIEHQESLQGVKKVDTSRKESLQQESQESLQPSVKKVDTYINSIDNNTIDTNLLNNTVAVAEKKGAGEKKESSSLGTEENPPTPPLSGAPPASPKKDKRIYGDGEFQKRIRAYFQKNPDDFPPEMIPDFLSWYTQIVQNDNPDENGKEYWRTLKKWSEYHLLKRWHEGYLSDLEKERIRQQQIEQQQANDSTRSKIYTVHATGQSAGQSGRPTGTAASYSGTTRSTASRPATVTPGMFRRDGQSSGNAHHSSFGGTYRSDVDPDYKAA